MSLFFRIGTRSSVLALWQAEFIAARLQAQGHQTQLVHFETVGDKQLDVSIAKIGSKGVFTEELEEALRRGDIDLAVHSAKDMQSSLPEDLELLAFTAREQPHDVVVSLVPNFSLETAPEGTLIGTSSTRRVATLKRHYPHLRQTEARGNLQTRLRKLQEGQFAALLLAYAGVHRLGWEDIIAQHLPLHIFTPPVGQGSVAVEAHRSLEPAKKAAIRQACNDTDTELCLLAERAFLKTLQGGCSIPVYGMASLDAQGISLRGGILSLDGRQHQEVSARLDKRNPLASKILGVKVAQDLLDQGAGDILAEIRQQLGRN